MTYIVGFNGPPHCGKDTVANALQDLLEESQKIPTVRAALSLPMRLVGFTMLGLEYSDELYAQIKDEPKRIFHRRFIPDGVEIHPEPPTLRRFMINFSERFIKPYYGHDFWARQLRERCPLWGVDGAGILIVSDIGFQAEVDYFQTHARSYLQVNLLRDGADSWEKDSRSYVKANNLATVENNGTPFEAVGHVISAITRLGWLL